MSNTPNYDAKVAKILDALAPGERTCAMTGQKWNMSDEEIGWYKKFQVPPSAVAPQTRWMHHGLWYVGYQYWYQSHPETGKPIICTVHPATGIKVLPDQEWFQKDFTQMGREYDLSKSFFEQWRELQLSVPMSAQRNHVEPKNSISFVSQGDEDSYFVGASKSKRTIYSHVATDTEDSCEVYQGFSIQNSYNVVHSHRIFNSKFVRECYDCLNSAFLFDCRNCEFCFGATNKRNKKYVWFNEQLSKEEWEKRMAEVDLGSRRVSDDYLSRFYRLIAEQGVWPENFNNQDVDSTGEYLNKTTNVRASYFCAEGGVDEYFCNFSLGASRQNAFTGYPVFATDCYYSASISRGGNCKFCFLNIQSNQMEYSLLCYNCENCFGCIGLQRKQFCILNKQYTEEEYWKRVDVIKCAMMDRGEYGEFFPARFSPSYHGDSGGSYWFGATPSDLKGIGVLEFDPESMGAIGQELADPSRTKNVSELPDHVAELGDEWIGVPLFDTAANRRFAMIKPEVEMYRRLNIAPPQKHFTSRIKDLWLQANQGAFEDAGCAKCGKSVRVAKNAGHPIRKIYCKEDYLKYLEEHG